MYINLKKFTFLFGGLILLILLNEQIGVNALPTSSLRARQGDTSLGTWEIIGDSGVNAMHTVLVAPRKVIFIDKLEQNHLKRPDGLAALSSIYDLDTNEAQPLGIYTNTFCSAGSFLGNGSLVEAGGDKGDANYRTGIQTVRVFDESIGDWHEIEGIMPSNRWYPAMASLPNGNVLILGGSKAATGVNRADINNPSYTIFPPPTGTMEDTPLEFLTTALPYNLYPMCHVIPNFEGKTLLFIFANQMSITYDLDTKTVIKEHPKIPGGIRSYPLTGTSVMLPLMSDTNYKPEIMICGGNKNYEVKSIAEASCGRLEITTEGAEWQMDDFGGTPRVMPDATYLVDGSILFVNGARYGFAGYRKGGGANAIWVNEDPVLYPTLYNTFERTYMNLAPSTIPRMYHSGSTLVPDGTILIAGSNPQGGVSLNVKYPTEYRVERFSPPYLFSGIPRPTILTLETYEINKDKIPVYYDQVVTMVISVTGQNPILKAAIIHHGFITHSQNFSQRYVFLDIENFYADTSAPDQYIVTVKMPPNPTIIAPGPSYLYVFNGDSPAVSGAHILLGTKTA